MQTLQPLIITDNAVDVQVNTANQAKGENMAIIVKANSVDGLAQVKLEGKNGDYVIVTRKPGKPSTSLVAGSATEAIVVFENQCDIVEPMKTPTWWPGRQDICPPDKKVGIGYLQVSKEARRTK